MGQTKSRPIFVANAAPTSVLVKCLGDTKTKKSTWDVKLPGIQFGSTASVGGGEIQKHDNYDLNPGPGPVQIKVGEVKEFHATCSGGFYVTIESITGQGKTTYLCSNFFVEKEHNVIVVNDEIRISKKKKIWIDKLYGENHKPKATAMSQFKQECIEVKTQFENESEQVKAKYKNKLEQSLYRVKREKKEKMVGNQNKFDLSTRTVEMLSDDCF